MLKKRGVQDVNQLQGGIHRYLEKYGNDGFFKGLNFVFDSRVAMKPNMSEPQNEVVGRCVECSSPFDEICGSRVCSVCHDLVLVCPKCQSALREYHCRRHSNWKDCYFTFLEIFDVDELTYQKNRLDQIRDNLAASPESKRNKKVRRTLTRQIEKISLQMELLKSGATQVDRNAPRRCRTCMEPNSVCDGRCWGFWKTLQSSVDNRMESCNRQNDDRGPLPIAVGDQVEPGDDWNALRLGLKTCSDGQLRTGTVLDIKSWAGVDNDCVLVKWNDSLSSKRNQPTIQPQIYRWGVRALNGRRLYDVRRVEG